MLTRTGLKWIAALVKCDKCNEENVLEYEQYIDDEENETVISRCTNSLCENEKMIKY